MIRIRFGITRDSDMAIPILYSMFQYHSIEVVLPTAKIYRLNDFLLVVLYLTANMSPLLKVTKLIIII